MKKKEMYLAGGGLITTPCRFKSAGIGRLFYPPISEFEDAMTTVLQFKHPDKQPHDALLRCDPFLESLELTPEARLIYLRIIDESEPGVLLRCDRLIVGLTAMQTDRLLMRAAGDGEIEALEEFYSSLLLPKLGREYIIQILQNEYNNASK
jgi:hypothetical protein